MNFNNGSTCFTSLGHIFVRLDHFSDDIPYWVTSPSGGYHCIWKKGKAYALTRTHDRTLLLLGITSLEETHVYH